MRNAWALFVAVGITVAVACTPGPNDDACTSVGGECIGSNQICMGMLPYPCAGSGGTCCSPGQSTPAGTSTAQPDAAPPEDASTTTPDTSTATPDSATLPDTSVADTGAVDTSTGDDGGDDAAD
jgi:hypothetical protein